MSGAHMNGTGAYLPTAERADLLLAPPPRRWSVQLAFDSVAQSRSFAWRGAEDDADHRRAWFTHSLLLQPEHGERQRMVLSQPVATAPLW